MSCNFHMPFDRKSLMVTIHEIHILLDFLLPLSNWFPARGKSPSRKFAVALPLSGDRFSSEIGPDWPPPTLKSSHLAAALLPSGGDDSAQAGPPSKRLAVAPKGLQDRAVVTPAP